MQGYAAGIAVLGLNKLDLFPGKVDLAPVEIDRFRETGPGVKEEDYEGPEVRRTCSDEAVCLGRG